MNNPSKVESILLAALEKATAEARCAYLDDVCRDNPGLREQVNRLLAAYPKAVEFLEMPAAAADDKTATYVPAVEQPGSILAGRYKLLEKIGEGGMGEVWVADQLEPIKRRIALKLIKPGMDSRSVLGRFEAERQALAVMDHPNIAKVLDAGATADGRPYFVMELVKGTPITEFCDARRLTPKQRLELFIPVCQAIQHAHHKGIIHRDIKPSNVLVALHDETPVAKVIDFGVAKAVGQQLTEKTIYTGFGALVGTPAYMAPEQATFNQLDVDTRADVYALGVLLYELLAGSPPIEKERLKQAALDELLRIVRDEEPPRPSQRLSTSQAKASIAATRQSDPARLSALMKGEIDWIVMKALEKDRTRRYDTANGLARDIQRYLAGDAVEACPPTLGYRLRKAYRKNRAAVRVASAFVALLITAVAVSTWLAVKATRAEAGAEDKRIEAEVNAKVADRNAGLYAGALWAADENRQHAELSAARLQIDLDLAEIHTDQQIGLLRLARTAKSLPADHAERHIRMSDGSEMTLSVPEEVLGEQRELREFVTAAVLTAGQNYAPLLTPITHDGHEITFHEESPDRKTVLTFGADATARLWDTRTAKQIAILRQGDERVLKCGFSPDGKTIYTDGASETVRLWEGGTGKFRAQTDPPTEADVVPLNAFTTRDVSIVDNRLLTKVSFNETLQNTSIYRSLSSRVELWDTATGRKIARFNQGDAGDYKFLGNNWIIGIEGRNTVLIFSANDGRILARLNHSPANIVSSVNISPNGLRLAISIYDQDASTTENYHGTLEVWDTATWNVDAPAQMPANESWQLPANRDRPHCSFLNDDLIANYQGNVVDTYVDCVYRCGKTEPIWIEFERAWELDSSRWIRSKNGKALTDDFVIFEVSNLASGKSPRIRPPAGRKFHPDLVRFSADGRFTGKLDLKTEKVLPDETGWHERSVGFIRHLPSPILDLPPEFLQLWAQVAVRGELGAEGEFVKWDEPNWEKKRQELAAIPPPYADLPFPGYVATDKLHWLRAEYEDAAKTDRLRLATELLERAEAVGDKIEAVRWRAVLAPKATPAEPPALQ